uniref:Uncharacterized protein n=1 Tax=Triticum urartu TaxID=4572 RepID=A0A8R7U7C0_TRIUA
MHIGGGAAGAPRSIRAAGLLLQPSAALLPFPFAALLYPPAPNLLWHYPQPPAAVRRSIQAPPHEGRSSSPAIRRPPPLPLPPNILLLLRPSVALLKSRGVCRRKNIRRPNVLHQREALERGCFYAA